MSDRDSGLDSGEESNDTMFMNDENNDNSSLENVGDAIGDEDDVDDDDDEDLNNYIVYNVNGDRGNGGAMMDNRAIISGNLLLNSSANHQMINNHYNDIIEIDPSPSPALSQISQSSMNHNLAQASTSFDNINFASSSSSGLMRASSSSLFPNNNNNNNNSSNSNSGTGSNQMFDQWSSSLVSSSFPALSSSSSLSSSGPSNSQSKMCLSTSIQEHQNNTSQHNQFDSNLASTSSSCSSSNSSILPPAPSSSPVVGVSSSFSSSSTLVVPSSSASSSSSSSALSISMSQNVNVFGVDFCINPADLSNLWNFYIDNSDMEQQQHEFCPKMSKKGHRRKFVQIQFSKNLIAEKKLRMASNANDFESVCRLLKAGVDTKACDERKRTALHFAACHGFIDIACALLDNGADPNQQDIVGNTPLHLAVCASKLDIVILLLKNGANCTASDNSGRTPLQLAKAKLTILSKSLEKSKSLLPELKLETLKISMMLGIYFEKSVITNNDDHSRQMKNQQQKEEIERFQNRINTGETAEELENDVNDLLRCIDKWTLT